MYTSHYSKELPTDCGSFENQIPTIKWQNVLTFVAGVYSGVSDRCNVM